MRRPLLVVLTGALIALTACIPTDVPGLRWPACRIVWYDATVPAGTGSPMAAYVEELERATGMDFVPSSKAAASDRGLLITTLTNAPSHVGARTSRVWGEDLKLSKVMIAVRPGTSAGLRRHELGHVFNLLHNERSAVMRKAPDPNGRWTNAELSAMRSFARSSGCR